MKKLGFQLLICFTAAAAVWTGSLFVDRQQLSRELIRLHVVGASDSGADQSCKLRVRDAVLEDIGGAMDSALSTEEAFRYLQTRLPRLQKLAEDTLSELGRPAPVTVTLEREPFPRRDYESFSLPAGEYQSLRVVIGPGEGHNWWCVAFPTLCLPAAEKTPSQEGREAGLSASACAAITGEKPYRLRFFLLDLLGRLQAGDRPGVSS